MAAASEARRCWARRASRRWPTSIRATSRRTSPGARSTVSCFARRAAAALRRACCWLSVSSGHVVYLHSALTQDRIPACKDAERAEPLRFERLDIVVAMTLPGQPSSTSRCSSSSPRAFTRPAILASTASRVRTPASSGWSAAVRRCLRRCAAGLGSVEFQRRDLCRPGRLPCVERLAQDRRPAL